MKVNSLISKITPEKSFIILAFIFGILLVFITPPFQVADEPNHFYRSYELSELKIVSKKINNESGNYIPKDVINMVQDLEGGIASHPDKKFLTHKLKKYWNIKTNFKNRQFIDFRNTALYSPVVYLPQALGIETAKLINFSPLFMIYLGRLFNLFTFIALAYFAIKLTPVCKWGFFLFSLMPMTLYQAASLSADSICFGLSFLFIAFILNCALSKSSKMTNKQIAIIALISVLLGLCKSAYFFTSFLFLLIPITKFDSKKKYFTSFFAIISITAVVDLIWAVLVKSIYVPIYSYVNPYRQLLYIFSHPQYFIAGFGKSIAHIGLLRSFVGNLGWLDNRLPLTLIAIFLGVAVLSALLENYKDLSLNLKQKIIIIMTIFLNFSLIQVMLYLSCSKVGDAYIAGGQGRYFIPIAPLFLLPLYNKFTNKLNVINNGGNLFFVCFIVVMLLITLFYVIKRYYGLV